METELLALSNGAAAAAIAASAKSAATTTPATANSALASKLSPQLTESLKLEHQLLRTGNREEINDLGFHASDGFHEYVIKWSPDSIEWLVDGKLVRKSDKKEGEGFPNKPMFLYASVWDASYIDEARWTGKFIGSDSPYVCLYKDIHVPTNTVVENETTSES